MVGDLMYEEQAPPEHVVFVCKLNPVTTSEDLELIFSQFGKVSRADVIKDWKTGIYRTHPLSLRRWLGR